MLVRWPYEAEGRRQWQREAVEMKVWRAGKRDPLEQGLSQLDAYLHTLGLDQGVLVIFDRRPDAGDIETRTTFEHASTPKGHDTLVLRG